MIVDTLPFRFNASEHTYTDLVTGEELQHVTGMLTRTGWVDPLWMTEASSLRGQAVHKLTADYDLEALDLATCVCGPYRPYLLAHVAARKTLGLEILAVEEPVVHPHYRFGGRPDRVVSDAGLVGPLEVKSGEVLKSHPIQTAIQAILLEPRLRVPAEFQFRAALYLQPNGKFKFRPHTDRGDIITARNIVFTCTGVL